MRRSDPTGKCQAGYGSWVEVCSHAVRAMTFRSHTAEGAALNPNLSLKGEGWAATAAVFAVAGCFTSWSALPGPHWFDTPEFTAVGIALSTSHAPGHPLHAIYMRAATLAPLGDAGLRGNASSAVAFALALALFYRVLRAAAPRAPRLLAACVALVPLFVPMLWFQAIRSEVYALQFVASALCARLCQRAASGRDLRDVPLLVFAVGIAGTCHSFIAALWVPFALWSLAAGARVQVLERGREARRALLRALAACVPAGLVALLPYAYLPLRALGGGDVGWGAPDSARELWRTISAEQWQQAVAAAREPLSALDNASAAADYVLAQLGVPAAAILLLLIAGGVLGLVRERSGGALAALASVLLVFAAPVIDPLNPDLGGYLMHGFAALLLLAWLAADACARMLPPRASPAWAFALVLALCAARFDPGIRAGARLPERIGRALLAEVPVGGTLVISEYTTNFTQWYLQAAEGLRPDVARVFRAQVHSDWLARRLATTHPDAAARLPGFARSFFTAGTRFEPGVEIQGLSEVFARLQPVGLTFGPPGTHWPSVAELAAIDRSLVRGEPPAAEGRRMLAYFRVQHATWLLSARTPSSAARALAAWDIERAGQLAPGDELVAQLRARLAQVGGP